MRSSAESEMKLVQKSTSFYFGFDIESLHFWKIEPIVPDESVDLGPGIGPVLEMVIA